jgi:hypothetical protein
MKGTAGCKDVRKCHSHKNQPARQQQIDQIQSLTAKTPRARTEEETNRSYERQTISPDSSVRSMARDEVSLWSFAPPKKMLSGSERRLYFFLKFLGNDVCARIAWSCRRNDSNRLDRGALGVELSSRHNPCNDLVD